MRGTLKTPDNLSNESQDLALEPKGTQFNLDQDENFSWCFDDKHMKMEPDDHPECLFEPMISSEKVMPIMPIKEETVNVEYVSFFPEEHSQYTQSIHDYSDSVKTLQDNCRLVQKIIFASSREPIYDYDIGFESQEDEPSKANQLVSKHEKRGGNKEEIPSLIKVQDEIESIYQQNIKHEEDSEFRTKDYPGMKSQKKNLTVVTVPIVPSRRQMPSWIIDLLIKYHETAITKDEKRRFLNLFDKLENMKRGIYKKTSEVNGKDHKCKWCGIQFDNGRKLGGHMSRTHPGNSFEYQLKKQRLQSNVCERNRKNYMKRQRRNKGIHRG